MMYEFRLQLVRDQLRTIERYFFPFMERLCDTEINNAGNDVDQLPISIINKYLFLEVKKSIETKLERQGNKIHLRLTIPQGFVFYRLLNMLPFPSEQVWLNNVRNLVTEILNNQIKELTP